MTNPFNSSENFNELIFENKNKSYGAYALRKAQGNTVAKSMFITFGAVSLLVLTAFTLTTKNTVPAVLDIDSIRVITVVLPPPVIPPVIEDIKPAVKVPYSDDLNFKADDEPVIDPPKAVVLAEQNSKGDKKGEIDSTEHKDPEVPVVVADPPKPEIVEVFVTEMPELKNMGQFIADNLHYPQIAVENGTSGTVFVSFVVEKDGSISTVKVLQPIGDGCEEEAVRVIKKMPNWTPGRNHGQLVRVQCTLPVRFKIK